MKIPYTLLDFSGEVKSMDSQWDMTLLKDILQGNTWQPAQGYEFVEDSSDGFTARNKGGVIIIPARQNAGKEYYIQGYLKGLEWCVVILIGDEERSFDYKKLEHPKMKLWLMHPALEDKADYYLGSGYTPHTRGVHGDFDKPLDWSFMGQNNHSRRQEAIDVLDKMLNREDIKGYLETSDGFTRGVEKETYISLTAQSKAVPAPSGIASPDSFRVYEALELGAVPIADDISNLITKAGYWRKIFGEHDIPFKVLTDYANLEGYIGDIVRDYPSYNNKVFAWWQGVKRDIVYKLNEHVHELSGIDYPNNDIRHKITVLILTSPIADHPSTKIIDQTISDLRKVLPDCEIIIGIDGVRTEQEDYRERYELYKQHFLWKCNNEWTNILPVVFDNHMHQAAMTRQLLKLVKTPTLLFVEHDTALAPDFEYDWEKFVQAIETGSVYTIRFHFEAVIPEEHKHMMIGEVEDICGLPLLKTSQWSQRPHLSSTVFYRDMMDRYFTDDSRTMIEDKVHGYPAEAYRTDGLLGWYNWRLWIYHPERNIKRSYTTDGRGNDPKYEMVF